MSETRDTPSDDFDFFMGNWRVRHRRLKDRLSGCTIWQEFSGTSVCRKILGGWGNLDDNEIDLPGGAYRAVTLRAYDPAQALWSIWWLDGRHPTRLDTPVVGRFVSGIGTFYADDTLAKKPIRVRFLWSHITPASCRWEQAFSPDGGAFWEVNWVMEFQRVA
jgi:hypothetical protein